MKFLYFLFFLFLSTCLMAESYLDRYELLVDTDAAYYKDRHFGVGTTSPSSNLHVVGSVRVSGNVYLSDVPTASQLIFVDSAEHAWIITDQLDAYFAPENTLGILKYNPLTDSVIVTSSIFFTPSGNLGLGMVDPLESIGIGGGGFRFPAEDGLDWFDDPGEGSDDSAHIKLIWEDTGNHELNILVGNDSEDDLDIRQAGATRLQLINGEIHVVNGNMPTIPSDRRYKRDITPIGDALKTVLSLEGVTYFWKNKTPHSRQLGLIAQDVKKVLPDQVMMHSDGYYKINYESVIPLLTEAIKEREIQIKELERRLEKLR